MSNLTKWNPLRSDRTLAPFGAFDRLFQDAFRGLPVMPFTALEDVTSFAGADVDETDEAVQVKVDLPGHDPESIQVRLESDTLTIESERKDGRYQGKFARSFVLGGELDGSAAQAKFEHGVLTVTVPKKEEAKPKTIEVKVQK